MRFAILLIYFCLFSSPILATKIVVIDTEYVVENHIQFISLINKINNDQSLHKDYFNNLENEINKNYDEIEKLKSILNEEELSKKIIVNEENIIKYNKKFENFNLHYQSQIDNMYNKIFNKLLEIIQKYALTNNIDLILNNKSYIIASNSIDISDNILKEINKLKFEIKFEPYN